MPKEYFVYILASQRNGTLYIGVTGDLNRRAFEHKSKKVQSFTKRYNVDKLVYAEGCDRIEDALAREKALKKWNRAWKLELIEKANPDWRDLFDDLNR